MLEKHPSPLNAWEEKVFSHEKNASLILITHLTNIKSGTNENVKKCIKK